MANCYGGNRIQNNTQTLNFLRQLMKTTEMMPLLRVLFLDTPGHPTSAPQHSNSNKYTIQVNIVITRSLGSNELNRVISESCYTKKSTRKQFQKRMSNNM